MVRSKIERPYRKCWLSRCVWPHFIQVSVGRRVEVTSVGDGGNISFNFHEDISTIEQQNSPLQIHVTDDNNIHCGIEE